MVSIVSQLLAQPWAVPILASIGAFLLGMLIPRRGGGTWLSGIVFFLPHLFLDLLDMVHTKKFKYYGLITALLAIEAFFAFRAATVYYDVLHTRMPGPEMAIVCVIVFVAIFLCGYMVATHGGEWNFGRGCTMVFVIIHDWAGTVWMNYSQPATASTNAAMTAPDDPLKVVLTIGMCVLGILPFIMGAWAEELRPQLEAELDEEVETFTSTATRKIKRRAVEKVLRLTNRTDVVRLVQALPAAEFLDFKRFVMPIIAEPGTPYHLPAPESEQQANARTNEDAETGVKQSTVAGKEQAEQRTNAQPEAGTHHSTHEDKAQGMLPKEKRAEPLPHDQPPTGQEMRHDDRQHGGQPDGQKPANQRGKKGAESGQPGGQYAASKTAKRDAKIRQLAEENPDLSHAKLAARFHLSRRTIGRILNGQTGAPEQAENSAETEPAPAPVATNGHHKAQERDTDQLVAVDVAEEEWLSPVHQN